MLFKKMYVVQLLIPSRFCDEVDDFLSPLLLIYIVMYEAMICVPLYQLVMVSK